MKLRQQFPRLGHSDQYRPMLGRSHHASELQALLGVLTIFFYFGASHKISPLRAPNAESSKWFQAELKIRRLPRAMPANTSQSGISPPRNQSPPKRRVGGT
jgi:hypothetical protein